MIESGKMSCPTWSQERKEMNKKREMDSMLVGEWKARITMMTPPLLPAKVCPLAGVGKALLCTYLHVS